MSVTPESRDLLIEELRRLLPPQRVMTDPAELFVYESDGFTIARARPAAVVFPLSTEEVVAVVRAIARHGAQIVPRGSGTGLAGGCVAYDNGVIVSTAKMNRILSIDIDNRVAQVEAGVRNVQLSEAVALVPGGAAYHFSPDPSSQRASTIGGNAATNAGGIHVLKDFVSSNHVLGLELVLPDGTVLELGAKNGCYEAGFDLPGLVCGSEGTFGIITKLWVRLTPKPTSFRTIVGIFGSTTDACNTVSQVIAAGHLPAAMEMMDGGLVAVVNETYQMGFPPSAAALVLTEIDGIDALLDEQMEQIVQIMQRNAALSVQTSADPDRRAKLWKARKNAFGAVGKLSPSYCTQDACVPRSTLADVLNRIHEIGRKYGVTITNVFHAGDGNVHPIFLYNDRDEKQVQTTLAAATEVLKYCIDVGGTLTGEHGVGVEKIHLMPYMFDEATMSRFQRVKDAFDPEDRINAGKLLPSEKLRVTLMKPGRNVPQ
ncbi:FAD-binding oxidoreductase [Fontivita pretiosa]|uniref:FAD-binding oxidoreductase n=1 Tax=Fontivita pretiosa TaxID=2989684 RepID=UPI003D17F258